MIDRVEYVDGNGNPIWTSDIEYWEEFIGYEEEFIGYENELGEIVMYEF